MRLSYLSIILLLDLPNNKIVEWHYNRFITLNGVHKITMVINTDGYFHIIEYLTEHLGLFENSVVTDKNAETVLSVIEVELSEQIISVCGQNIGLSFNQRNAIIREVDAIASDLEEILSGILNDSVTEEQSQFIKEFATLIKNLFDNEINFLLSLPS